MRGAFAGLIALGLSCCPCLAGSIRTLDGRTFEGDVRLEQSGQVAVTSKSGKPEKIDLADIFQADFRTDPPKTTPKPATPPARALREGLMLRSGTLLAGAQIEKAEEGSIALNKSGRRFTLPVAKVARIIFTELSADLISKIPEKRPGVLMKDGDFVEGEFKGMQSGQVVMSSVLFGVARFFPRQQALAVVLNDLEAAHADVIIRTVDGSIYMGQSFAAEKDKLTIEDAVGGSFAIARTEVTEFSAGAARFESLCTLKPAKTEPAAKVPGEGFFSNSTGVGLPMTLGNLTFERGVTLTSGASASWNLAKKYRTLSFKCGVPRGVLATAPLRFIVLADGKEVYKSKPLTSLDAPLAASVSVKDAASLTLRVECTAGESLAIPGVWGDAALLK